MTKYVIEFDSETLAKNILGRLDQWGYEPYLDYASKSLDGEIEEQRYKLSTDET